MTLFGGADQAAVAIEDKAVRCVVAHRQWIGELAHKRTVDAVEEADEGRRSIDVVDEPRGVEVRMEDGPRAGNVPWPVEGRASGDPDALRASALRIDAVCTEQKQGLTIDNGYLGDFHMPESSWLGQR